MTSNATHRHRLARATAAAALGALLAALSGCSLSPFHGRADVSDAPLVPRATDVPDDAAGTRARMAAEPGEAFWPYRLGALLAAADSSRAAEAALRRALALDPGHAASLALLSRLLFEQSRHAEAIREVETARARAFPNGMPAALLEGLALHYDAADRIDEANATLGAIPSGGRAGAARVYLTLRGSTPGAADALAAEAAKREPKSAVHQNNLGIARLRAGDPDGAAKAFDRAIDLDAALPGPYYNMAILEKFYRFDDAAAARWFARYRERAAADPDGLAGLIGGDPPIAERKAP